MRICVIIIDKYMEWPWKQFELWPRTISPDELNEELEKAGRRGERRSEDLVSKEETTKALEGEDAKEIKILSPRRNAEKAREVIEKLEKGEKEENKKKK